MKMHYSDGFNPAGTTKCVSQTECAESPMDEVMRRLHHIADRANEQAARIESKLIPVLRERPATLNSLADVTGGGVSPLVSELGIIAEKLDRAYSWLSTTEERLTL